jgi:hypothetical protein
MQMLVISLVLYKKGFKSNVIWTDFPPSAEHLIRKIIILSTFQDNKYQQSFWQVSNVVYYLRKVRNLHVYGNEILGKVFGPEEDEVSEHFTYRHYKITSIYNMEFRDLRRSPSIGMAVKFARLRWSGRWLRDKECLENSDTETAWRMQKDIRELH